MPKQAKKQPKQNAQPARAVIHMPATTDAYLKSLCAPMTYRNTGVPSSGSSTILSLKQHVFLKGTMTIGTQGFGFVMAAPGRAVANNVAAVVHSSNLYAGTTFSSLPGPGVVNAFSNSMFQNADIGAQPLAAFRVVSAGLRVRYNGRQIDLGGTSHLIQQPRHESIDGLGANALDAYVQSKRDVVNRVWDNVVYCPITLGFVDNVLTPAYSDFFMGALVQSTAGNTFDWEFYVNLEIAGVNIRGVTPCVNDPVGSGAILAAMASHGGSFKGNDAQQIEAEVTKTVRDYLIAGMTWIGDKALPALATVVEKTPAVLTALGAII